MRYSLGMRLSPYVIITRSATSFHSTALAVQHPVQLLPYCVATDRLLLPDCVRLSCCSLIRNRIHYSCCGSVPSMSLPDCVHFSCCPKVASTSPPAPRSCPLAASGIMEGSSPCHCPAFSHNLRKSSRFGGSNKVQRLCVTIVSPAPECPTSVSHTRTDTQHA